MTELEIAYLNEPQIADRLTLVWIGGHGYESSASEVEFNTSADLIAAQILFRSAIPIWQVPEPTYAQCLVSWAELYPTSQGWVRWGPTSSIAGAPSPIASRTCSGRAWVNVPCSATARSCC